MNLKLMKPIIAGTAAIALLMGPAASFAKGDNGSRPNAHADARASSSLHIDMKGLHATSTKEHDGDKDHATSTATSSPSCLKAFGHLIAPGWIKNFGAVSVGDACRLPFGIFRHLHGATSTPPSSTSTPDVTAPVMSSLSATSTASTTMTVSWTTNEPSTSAVFYATSSPLSLSTTTTQSVATSSLVTTHSVSLTGLTASTTYFLEAQSRDASGNTSTSAQFSLTTGI